MKRLSLALLALPLLVLPFLGAQEGRRVIISADPALAAQVAASLQAQGNTIARVDFVVPEFVQKKDDKKEVPKKAPSHGKGYKRHTPEQRKVVHAAAFKRHGHRLAFQAKFTTLPSTFDVRDKGWAPPIGDQGQCASCYLYSTTWTITGAFLQAGYGKPDGSFLMAVQYGMDCHDFGGCDGGNGTEVIDWYIKNGGVPAETWVDESGQVHKDYPPYEARTGSCRKVAGAKSWIPADWGFCTGDQSDRQPTLAEVKTAMVRYGMINIALDAGDQFSQATSMITSLGDNIDHEINCIAYKDDANIAGGGAFLLMNQWSNQWGNAGYQWVTYDAALKHIVDWFWTTAAPLPPPPPGPTPPGPVNTGTVTFAGTGTTLDGKTFYLSPNQPSPPTPAPPRQFTLTVNADGTVTVTPVDAAKK